VDAVPEAGVVRTGDDGDVTAFTDRKGFRLAGGDLQAHRLLDSVERSQCVFRRALGGAFNNSGSCLDDCEQDQEEAHCNYR
jgi:hypothetical protein